MTNTNLKYEYIRGLIACLAISLGFMLFSEPCFHWFMLPVTLCGILLASDLQVFLREQGDLFNPSVIIAFLGLYFFYLAPILHVTLDSWMQIVTPPADWRPWLGYMGGLNLVGLIIYRRISGSRLATKKLLWLKQWSLNENRFVFVCGLALLITLLLQVYVYQEFGGILGYIFTFESGDDGFTGWGWVFMISESFPILVLMAFAVAARKNKALRRWSIIAFFLVLFIGLKILFGGLRGSRGNTIWSIFWALGIIHYWIRPLTRTFIISGLIFLIVFMYSFGVYKSHGLRTFNAMTAPLALTEMAKEGGRTFDTMMLGDFGRSDVQAYLLYRIADTGTEYSYKWGQTYISGLTLLIPQSIRPELVGKREAGTEAQYGRSSDNFLSSRIYGLAGEAILNWGFLSVPFVFALFGLALAYLQRFILSIDKNDVRILFVPFLVYLSILMLTADADNMVFACIKNGVVPALVISLSSIRRSGKVFRNDQQ